MWVFVLRCSVALLGVALIAIGVTAVLAPDFAAKSYGVEVTTLPARVWVRAAGVRDIAIGGILLGLLARRVEATSLGITVLLATLVPIVDSVIVLQTSGVRPAVILHAGTILPLMALGIALILSSRSSPPR